VIGSNPVPPTPHPRGNISPPGLLPPLSLYYYYYYYLLLKLLNSLRKTCALRYLHFWSKSTRGGHYHCKGVLTNTHKGAIISSWVEVLTLESLAPTTNH
jgi:hypothetical protein